MVTEHAHALGGGERAGERAKTRRACECASSAGKQEAAAAAQRAVEEQQRQTAAWAPPSRKGGGSNAGTRSGTRSSHCYSCGTGLLVLAQVLDAPAVLLAQAAVRATLQFCAESPSRS